MRYTRTSLACLTVSLVAATATFGQVRIAPVTANDDDITVVVVDAAGDGVELPATVRSTLVGRAAVEVRWTAAATDDGFLMARNPVPADGEARPEWLLVQAGHLRRSLGSRTPGRSMPDARAAETGSRWSGLTRFDQNNDGRLTAAAGELDRLAIFTDRNGDGVVSQGELTTLADAGVTGVTLPAGDAAATTLERTDGSVVTLRLVEIRKQP